MKGRGNYLVIPLLFLLNILLMYYIISLNIVNPINPHLINKLDKKNRHSSINFFNIILLQ